MAADKWAARRTGTDTASVVSAPSGSPSQSAASSVSSASDEGYKDDKFHLPVDHRPLILLPGWDRPPQAPEPPGGSSSGSSSESGSDSASGSDSGSSGSSGSTESHASEEPGGSTGSSGTNSASGGGAPLAPPPPTGFSCATCAYFRAHGNGTFGCDSEDYQRWAGTDKLVETKSGRAVQNPQLSCSDWYEPAQPHGGQPIPTRHNQG